MTWTVSTSGYWIIAIGVVLSAWPHPLGAQEDHYPALGFTLPSSSVQAVSEGLRGEPKSLAKQPSSASPGKLRGIKVASTFPAPTPLAAAEATVFQRAAHVQSDLRVARSPAAAPQAAAPQIPVIKSPNPTPQPPYTLHRQTDVVPQPAMPPPDFTGSRPPVGASPPGLWLVSQFLGELPVDLQTSSRPVEEPAATTAEQTGAVAIRPSSSHRLASHQRASEPAAPPPIPPVPTQEPLIAPVPPTSNEPPAIVEIVAGTPPTNSYQPVLWPNYLEGRLIPSFPPACQPICRPCRPPIPACCPCR
jgi:hypothetical protein